MEREEQSEEIRAGKSGTGGCGKDFGLYSEPRVVFINGDVI